MIKPIYGVMAEFDNPSALVNAARAAREKGYRKLDAYSPFPIEELSDALYLHKNKLYVAFSTRHWTNTTDVSTIPVTSRCMIFRCQPRPANVRSTHLAPSDNATD